MFLLIFALSGQLLAQGSSDGLESLLNSRPYSLKEIAHAIEQQPDLLTRPVPRPHGKGLVSPLLYAVEKGDPALVRLLLERGASPNAAGGPGDRPPLHRVFSSLGDGPARLEMLQILVDKGADLKGQDALGRNVFHALSETRGWDDTGTLDQAARLLKERGAPLAGEDSRGFTPLLSAIMRHDPHMTELLMSLGADPRATSRGLGLDGVTLARRQRDSLCRPVRAERVLELVTR